MDVNTYILKFCGMFDCSGRQRNRLMESQGFTRVSITEQSDGKAWEYIKSQYYPAFRHFVSNELITRNGFALLSGCGATGERGFEKTLRTQARGDVTLRFGLKNSEIFLFEQSPGIVALEFILDVPDLTLDDISAFVNETRYYTSTITDVATGEEITMRELMECVLAADNKPEKFFDVESSAIAKFRGAKLKVFQCVNFVGKPEKELALTAFELATVSREDAITNEEEGAHSKAYYQAAIGDGIAVYNNWYALCLFDTFTMVGYGYLDAPLARKTWSENYFRIYVYNLYFKYYLFSINAAGVATGVKLKRQRKRLNEFMHKYDIKYISYNFLPNLIHEKIRKGLDTDDESRQMVDKIERLSGLINERTNSLTNWILFTVAVIALLPNNAGDLMEGHDRVPEINWALLLIKVGVVLVVCCIKGFPYLRSIRR